MLEEGSHEVLNGELRSLSIRAASWVAARGVRRFCNDRELEDVRVERFCSYLEDAATAGDVCEWFEGWTSLEVAGMGDELPAELEAVPLFRNIVEAAHEITASQMYCAWTQSRVVEYLNGFSESRTSRSGGKRTGKR